MIIKHDLNLTGSQRSQPFGQIHIMIKTKQKTWKDKQKWSIPAPSTPSATTTSALEQAHQNILYIFSKNWHQKFQNGIISCFRSIHNLKCSFSRSEFGLFCFCHCHQMSSLPYSQFVTLWWLRNRTKTGLITEKQWPKNS